ncbi:MAG: HAMP domain-containing protein [Gammaproteobacteria bacterium]|nr:HAMP domain-containing protein [Gammaproteobacteria bacterium]
MSEPENGVEAEAPPAKRHGLLGRLARMLDRIAVRLYLAIGGAVLLTMAASLVGWLSFDAVGDAQERVGQRSVPGLVGAFGLARQSNLLAVAAERLAAATTPAELERVRGAVGQDLELFEEHLEALANADADDAVLAVRTQAHELAANIEAVERSVGQRFVLSGRREDLSAELATLQTRFEASFASALDDQFFFTVTGFRDLDSTAAPQERHLNADQVMRYRHLTELYANATIGTRLVAMAFTSTDAALLEPLRERFEAASDGARRSLSRLGEAELPEELVQDFNRLFAIGFGEDAGFSLRASELALLEEQQTLAVANRGLAAELVDEINVMVGAAEQDAATATEAAADVINIGENALLLLNAFSIVGALAIAMVVVAPLLRRLQRLADRMRQMAAGDLKSSVEIEGNDEVAELGRTLEVFRLRSIEAQRLNLVERQAEELRRVNSRLEDTLGELRRAQDQIVMREKLAALGELTAGVAHEIRNPLNFVKNFAEGCTELLTELNEELADLISAEAGHLDDEQREYVAEINGDMSENLERILHHTRRADRIVRDMLSMGRGGGERRPAPINDLLDEHARLAYHSARATDSDFNMEIETDYDPDAGEIEVVPQDVGRVFLNMVSNAAYATNEKRRAREEAGAADDGWEPGLKLSTRRRGDSVEVQVHDNGSGIPSDLVDKVFNPFFTTKPTDQGTGLGLALSADIIRNHGGSIRVDTAAGEYTTMIVELPVKAPASATAIDDEDDDDADDDEGVGEDNDDEGTDEEG